MRNRQSQDAHGLIVHQHVSLMVCEDPAVFEEIFGDLALDELNYQRIGPRALLVPAIELPALAAALNERGVYPKIVGDPIQLNRDSEGEEQ